MVTNGAAAFLKRSGNDLTAAYGLSGQHKAR